MVIFNPDCILVIKSGGAKTSRKRVVFSLKIVKL